MKRGDFKVIVGGKEQAAAKQNRRFLSAFVTNTRLMGVVGLSASWETETEDGGRTLLHQFFYYDAEEYGLESYQSVWGNNPDELLAAEQSLIGGLGGEKIMLTEAETAGLIRHFARHNRRLSLPLPEPRSEYAFLLAPGASPSPEALLAKMCCPIRSDYQAANYFLMRCFAKDFEGAAFLTSPGAFRMADAPGMADPGSPEEGMLPESSETGPGKTDPAENGGSASQNSAGAGIRDASLSAAGIPEEKRCPPAGLPEKTDGPPAPSGFDLFPEYPPSTLCRNVTELQEPDRSDEGPQPLKQRRFSFFSGDASLFSGGEDSGKQAPAAESGPGTLYRCESLIEDNGRYSILVTELLIRRRQIVSWHRIATLDVSPQEASLLLMRSEFITVYEFLFEPEHLEEALAELTARSMFTLHENGRLYLSFKKNNDHTGKKEYRLNDDVAGICYLSDFGQLILAAYSRHDIEALEYRLYKNPLRPCLSESGRYEFKEPILYEFVHSDFDIFEDFIDFIRE